VNASVGLLSTASDPDGDLPLVASVVAGSGPAHGTLNLQPDGSFTYAPTPGYSGADAFNFTVTDHRNGTVSRQATITVGESPDAIQ
jgi:VCBS repeat-containing protein